MILTYIHPISLFLAVKEQVLSFHSAGFYLVSILVLMISFSGHLAGRCSSTGSRRIADASAMIR